MTWFEMLTGFHEGSPDQIHRNITVDGEAMTFHPIGRTVVCGRLETPSLAELRERAESADQLQGQLSVREVVADVQELHADPSNAGALFQVASQFNLLEMVSPDVTPEDGVTRYQHDRTQGPACAIAAGAGTIYRNYFVPVNGETGQTASRQVDCLADLGAALGNVGSRLWQMRNGYSLPTQDGLMEIAGRLEATSGSQLAELRDLIRVGLQWNTQVTLHGCTHLVSQAYCSALPVAYARYDPKYWEGFARLVLQAAYEATLCAAIVNARDQGNHTVCEQRRENGGYLPV